MLGINRKHSLATVVAGLLALFILMADAGGQYY